MACDKIVVITLLVLLSSQVSICVGLLYPGAFETRAEEDVFIQRLLNQSTLFTNPKNMVNETVYVYLDMHQLLNVDEKAGIIDVKFIVYVYYILESLSWNATETPVFFVSVPQSRLWVPDVTLSEMTEIKSQSSDNLIVLQDGMVSFASIMYVKSACSFDVTYFPYDTQVCKFTLRQFSTNRDMFDLEPSHYSEGRMSLDSYQSSDQWDLTEAPVARKITVMIPGEPYPHAALEYSLKLRRMPEFFRKIILVPAVILLMVSILAFALPVESGEKVSLAITALLSQTVNMLALQEILPASSANFPIFGNFVLFSIIVTTVSVLATVLVIDIHMIGAEREVPDLMVKFLTCDSRSWLLGLKKVEDVPSASAIADETNRKISTMTLHDISEKGGAQRAKSPDGGDKESSESRLSLIERHLEETRREERTKMLWQKLALTIDRLFLIVYSAVVMFGCVYYFCRMAYQL